MKRKRKEKHINKPYTVLHSHSTNIQNMYQIKKTELVKHIKKPKSKLIAMNNELYLIITVYKKTCIYCFS